MTSADEGQARRDRCEAFGRALEVWADQDEPDIEHLIMTAEYIRTGDLGPLWELKQKTADIYGPSRNRSADVE